MPLHYSHHIAYSWGADNKWHKPADIYIDAPHLDTGLGEYFSLAGVSNKPLPLPEFYQSLSIDAGKITRFAEKLGCATRMTVTGTSCRNNPQWSYLCNVSGERYTSPIDRDYLFSHFRQLALTKSERLSKLVWATMCALPVTAHSYDSAYSNNPLRAVYQKNERGGARFAILSSFISSVKKPGFPKETVNSSALRRPVQNCFLTALPSIPAGHGLKPFNSERTSSYRMRRHRRRLR